MAIKPLTITHEIEPWGRACPGMLLSRGGHGQRRCIISKGVLVRPSLKAHIALTGENVLPADEMGGWVDCSHLGALALLDRTGACPERSRRVQGTAPAATACPPKLERRRERDFVAPAGARLLSWSQESKTQTGFSTTNHNRVSRSSISPEFKIRLTSWTRDPIA